MATQLPCWSVIKSNNNHILPCGVGWKCFADSPLLLRPRLPVHRNHGSNDYPAQYRCTTTPAPSRTSHLISGSHHPGKAGISQPKAVLDNMSVITPPDVSPLPKTYRGALYNRSTRESLPIPHAKNHIRQMRCLIPCHKLFSLFFPL
jgi:hypothetical protein